MNKPGPDTRLETARLILSPVSDEYKQDICDEFKNTNYKHELHELEFTHLPTGRQVT